MGLYGSRLDAVVTPLHYTEVRFASFLSGGFITVAVINPPESKLEKCTYVHCEGVIKSLPHLNL